MDNVSVRTVSIPIGLQMNVKNVISRNVLLVKSKTKQWYAAYARHNFQLQMMVNADVPRTALNVTLIMDAVQSVKIQIPS